VGKNRAGSCEKIGNDWGMCLTLILASEPGERGVMRSANLLHVTGSRW